jgi:hypothetical protein
LEQVGEHHCDAGGCLASTGSSGIAGVAGSGSELTRCYVQPVASSISSAGISSLGLVLFLHIVSHLLRGRIPALFFFAGQALSHGNVLRLGRSNLCLGQFAEWDRHCATQV